MGLNQNNNEGLFRWELQQRGTVLIDTHHQKHKKMGIDWNSITIGYGIFTEGGSDVRVHFEPNMFWISFYKENMDKTLLNKLTKSLKQNGLSKRHLKWLQKPKQQETIKGNWTQTKAVQSIKHKALVVKQYGWFTKTPVVSWKKDYFQASFLLQRNEWWKCAIKTIERQGRIQCLGELGII